MERGGAVAGRRAFDNAMRRSRWALYRAFIGICRAISGAFIPQYIFSAFSDDVFR
jgi:hypothetical protein